MNNERGYNMENENFRKFWRELRLKLLEIVAKQHQTTFTATDAIDIIKEVYLENTFGVDVQEINDICAEIECEYFNSPSRFSYNEILGIVAGSFDTEYTIRRGLEKQNRSDEEIKIPHTTKDFFTQKEPMLYKEKDIFGTPEHNNIPLTIEYNGETTKPTNKYWFKVTTPPEPKPPHII